MSLGFSYLLQVKVNFASSRWVVGCHSQDRVSGVPCHLRGDPARLRGIDAVVKVDRHVPNGPAL